MKNNDVFFQPCRTLPSDRFQYPKITANEDIEKGIITAYAINAPCCLSFEKFSPEDITRERKMNAPAIIVALT
jgi:hypothetical protein